ncbi:dihydrolipoyl dehydrogenase [Methylicorpusculum oleiharenae]|nr:dihydrolipoyl dehydrogenase [Methylicorpusculum oleiharenae]MCD2453311.1 dihydrolipoyl dehydrogenase [Methylicorpusculum oleiharenae]
MSKYESTYDVIVLGAGPAGYVAAIRAAQLGLKTACVDNWMSPDGKTSLGGTYINAGCISSMALLESAKIYHQIRHDIKDHGISVDNISLDVPKMIARKDKKVDMLSKQIKQVFADNGIDFIHGSGKLMNARQVSATPPNGGKPIILNAKNVILATGSSPIELNCAAIDNDVIIDSTAALSLQTVPKKLGIIGAGIIGLEIGGIWNKLGSDVTLLEAQEIFLHVTDQQISLEAYKIYTDQGLDLRMGTRVISAKRSKDKVIVEYQDQEGNHTLKLDKLIVASGRKPNSENIAAPEAELVLDENGYIHVDEKCCTTVPGVYAIGDLTLLGPMLAHKGLEEGVFVAEQIANMETPINYDIIPSVIYTDPEIAWVGHTEQAVQAMGIKYNTGVFPLKANGRAEAIDKTEGLVKIITNAETDIIMGVHIIGINASELIAEAVLAMEFSASSEDLARTIHAHPTISEVLHEAALAIDNRSLHLP